MKSWVIIWRIVITNYVHIYECKSSASLYTVPMTWIIFWWMPLSLSDFLWSNDIKGSLKIHCYTKVVSKNLAWPTKSQLISFSFLITGSIWHVHIYRYFADNKFVVIVFIFRRCFSWILYSLLSSSHYNYCIYFIGG